MRTNVIARPIDLVVMERDVAESIARLQDAVGSMRHNLDGFQADEAQLNAKIEKKKVELERAEKRLRSLQSVRPAYMDEYDKIEAELVRVYQDYVERFRNVAFLEQKLEEHTQQEQDKYEEAESSLKRMQEKLREDEIRMLKGNESDYELESALSVPMLGRGVRTQPADEADPSISLEGNSSIVLGSNDSIIDDNGHSDTDNSDGEFDDNDF